MSGWVLHRRALDLFTQWAADPQRWNQFPDPLAEETVVGHARDIPDRVMLGLVDQLQHTLYDPWLNVRYRSHWVSQWDLAGALRLLGYRAHHGDGEMPSALVLAKATRLIGRHLLDGCPCGCRGDFELTEAGKAMLADPASTEGETKL